MRLRMRRHFLVRDRAGVGSAKCVFACEDTSSCGTGRALAVRNASSHAKTLFRAGLCGGSWWEMRLRVRRHFFVRDWADVRRAKCVFACEDTFSCGTGRAFVERNASSCAKTLFRVGL